MRVSLKFDYDSFASQVFKAGVNIGPELLWPINAGIGSNNSYLKIPATVTGDGKYKIDVYGSSADSKRFTKNALKKILTKMQLVVDVAGEGDYITVAASSNVTPKIVHPELKQALEPDSVIDLISEYLGYSNKCCFEVHPTGGSDNLAGLVDL